MGSCTVSVTTCFVLRCRESPVPEHFHVYIRGTFFACLFHWWNFTAVEISSDSLLNAFLCCISSCLRWMWFNLKALYHLWQLKLPAIVPCDNNTPWKSTPVVLKQGSLKLRVLSLFVSFAFPGRMCPLSWFSFGWLFIAIANESPPPCFSLWFLPGHSAFCGKSTIVDRSSSPCRVLPYVFLWLRWHSQY